MADAGADKVSALVNCIYGTAQPELVKAEADTWNDCIRNDLLKAMEEVKASADGDIPLDTDHTFHLSLAARAADDNFTPYGKYGILDENDFGWTSFNVVLTPGQHEDISDNTENWMIADTACW